MARIDLRASIFAALGVAPLACGASQPEVSAPAAVSAREVTPGSGASSSATSSVAPTPAPSAPPAGSILGASSAAPMPSAAASTSPPAAAPADALPLGMLEKASVSAPPVMPRPSAPPASCRGLGCIQGQATASEANCGARVDVVRRVADVRAGLRPRAGLSADETDRAARALARARVVLRVCAASADARVPLETTTDLTVVASAPGQGAAASFTVTPEPPGLMPCLTAGLRRVLGGDATAAGLTFDVRITMSRRPRQPVL